MTKGIIKLLVIIILLVGNSGYTTARKTGYRLKGDNKELKESGEMVKGSFMVASNCPDCNKGYRIEQISFSGFDKPATSSRESFFIHNSTDRTLSGVSLYIEYLNAEGEQLHKRWLKLDCNIPPGETRQALIESWDKQKSFHYLKSRATHDSEPFSVKFDPVALYLRF